MVRLLSALANAWNIPELRKRIVFTLGMIAIYEAVEGRIGNPECLLSLPLCSGNACVLGGLVEKVHTEVMTYLSGTSLATLAERVQIPEPCASGDCGKRE